MIVSKYGEDAMGWTSNIPNGPHRCSIWKGSCNEYDAFSKFIAFVVHKVTRVRFCDDV